jgi:hypothetical protein
MSAAALFVPPGAGGHYWTPYDDLIMTLPTHLRTAAHEVAWAILQSLDWGDTATDITLTDKKIARMLGRSLRFVQKGLHALQTAFGEGQGLIHRIRTEGRRIIVVISRFAGRGRTGEPARGIGVDTPAKTTADPAPSPQPDPAPPQTPPREFEQTTTDSPSSSSPEILPEKTPEGPAFSAKPPTPDDPAIAELVDRACRLIPEVTPGQVRTAIGEYTAEWVSLALDRVEHRNRTPGNKAVRSWGFVLTTLQNRRKEGWTPPAAKPATQPPAARKAFAEPLAPQPLLSAEQLAELVEQSSHRDVLGRLAASQIRRAILDGQVPAELMGSIPAAILAGLEVPAAGSGS